MKIGKLQFIFTIVTCIFLTSCEKNTGINRFTGSYTYKISGKIGVVTSVLGDTVSVNLTPEFGQMNITKGSSSNKVVVTWDNLLGDVCHTTATIDGNTITLDQGKKNIPSISSVGSDLSVNFTGSGTLYDNMLIIPMKYSTEYSLAQISFEIVSSDLECVAKANN